MLGYLGWIPFLVAFDYMKNYKERTWEYFVIGLSYLTALPLVYVDFIYGDFGEINFLLQRTPIPTMYRGILFVSGMFLLIRGLQQMLKTGIMIIRKVATSEDESE